jgi:hypothetical protein
MLNHCEMFSKFSEYDSWYFQTLMSSPDIIAFCMELLTSCKFAFPEHKGKLPVDEV